MTAPRPTNPVFDWSRITWGRPDSVPTAICSYCSGALPDVPVIMWRKDGHSARFCDECADAMFAAQLKLRWSSHG